MIDPDWAGTAAELARDPGTVDRMLAVHVETRPGAEVCRTCGCRWPCVLHAVAEKAQLLIDDEGRTDG